MAIMRRAPPWGYHTQEERRWDETGQFGDSIHQCLKGHAHSKTLYSDYIQLYSLTNCLIKCMSHLWQHIIDGYDIAILRCTGLMYTTRVDFYESQKPTWNVNISETSRSHFATISYLALSYIYTRHEATAVIDDTTWDKATFTLGAARHR